MRTVLTYLGILRGYESLQKIDAHLIRIKEYRGMLENMVEEGAADETQAVLSHDIQIQLENTRMDIDAQMQSAMAEYEELTGAPVSTEMVIPSMQAELVDMGLEDAVRWAHENHPALVAASLDEKAITHEIGVEKAAYYPDLSGELSYLKSDKEDLLGGEIDDGKALIRMNWDFSTGGATAARIRKTKYRLKESHARYNDLARQIERDIQISYSDMDKAGAQRDLSFDRKEIHEKLLASYEVQFEGALVTLLQMLQAHNSLFSADMEFLNAEYSYLAAQYALLASMGRLQESMNIETLDRDE